MRQRGRTSSEAASTRARVTIEPDRPDPPADLSPEARAEWAEIVAAMPADWFPRETWPLLAAFCRHAATARRLSAWLEQTERAEGFQADEWLRLVDQQRRESTVLASLATKLRLSNQSRYRPQTAATRREKAGAATARPWAYGGAAE